MVARADLRHSGAVSDARPVLAVLGGSFNPPHLGHAMLPAFLLARGDVDRVLVAPCADHPLGKELAPFVRRLGWVRTAMNHYGERVEVSGIEAELAERSGGQPSYTLNLLEAIAEQRPDYRVRLVVGSDIVESGETQRWHRWDRICERFPPIVVPRAGWAPPGAAALPEISSTVVRAKLSAIRSGKLGYEVASRELEAMMPGPVVDSVLRWIQEEEPSVWIIGHGHVARHMVPLIEDRALCPLVLGARALCSKTPPELPEKVPLGVYLVCRDDALASLAEALVGYLPEGVPVLHAAGALRASEVLAPLAEAGHPVGTLHPICSMRSELASSRLEAASYGVEYSDEGREVLETFVLALLGVTAFEQRLLDITSLDAQQRLAYHGACALVANHLAVLQEHAGAVLSGLGLDPAASTRALGELMLGSMVNLSKLGVPRGITGPLSRGDRRTVEAHVAALETLDAETASLYGELSERLAKLLNVESSAPSE